MTGLDLFFNESMDYERTHQLVFSILLSRTPFGKYLFSADNVTDVKWEPKNRLFDLYFSSNGNPYYLEFKVWSELTERQIQKQTKSLIKNNARIYYVLLGTSWFENDESDIKKVCDPWCGKIGYDEIFKALDKLLSECEILPEVYELVKSYREMLKNHQIKFFSSSNKSNNILLYYPLYYQLKNCVPHISTKISRASFQGGQQAKMSLFDIASLTNGFHQIKVFCELINGKLYFRAKILNIRSKTNTELKKMIQAAIDQTLGAELDLLHSHRNEQCSIISVSLINYELSNSSEITNMIYFIKIILDKLMTLKHQLEESFTNLN